jgi:hypothetical protein
MAILRYVLFENVMWTATSGQINKWRRKTLKVSNTDMGHLAQSKITFIYNFSPVSPLSVDLSMAFLIYMTRRSYQNLWTGPTRQSSPDSKLSRYFRKTNLIPLSVGSWTTQIMAGYLPLHSLNGWRRRGKTVKRLSISALAVSLFRTPGV